jgi:hypothetical protein
MPVRTSRGITIYTGNFNASELIILSHGGMSEGDGTVKVPQGTQVIFYTHHWATGSGGRVADALAGRSPGSYKANANSIASGGSNIWNYSLTWDGPGGKRPNEKKLIDDYAHGLGSPLRDLATPEGDANPNMKDLFKAIEKIKGQYDVIHYCPCRCVTSKAGEDVYDPILAAKMNTMKFL